MGGLAVCQDSCQDAKGLAFLHGQSCQEMLIELRLPPSHGRKEKRARGYGHAEAFRANALGVLVRSRSLGRGPYAALPPWGGSHARLFLHSLIRTPLLPGRFKLSALLTHRMRLSDRKGQPIRSTPRQWACLGIMRKVSAPRRTPVSQLKRNPMVVVCSGTASSVLTQLAWREMRLEFPRLWRSWFEYSYRTSNKLWWAYPLT